MRYSIPTKSATFPALADSWVKSVVAIGVVLAVGFSRLVFVRSTPINWDAAQFSLALSRFDLHHHQPHPPGYILYVALGRLADMPVGNPDITLAVLSVIFSVVAVALIYSLGLRIFEDRGVALGASLLLASSPLALYYGSVGLTYVPELACSLGIALLAWRTRQSPSAAGAALLGAALGIAGGIRQTSIVVLLPLCCWALWGSGRSKWAAFFGSLAASCVLWLVPLLWLSGGIGAYLRESSLLAAAASKETSITTAGIEGFLYNASFEGLGLALGLAFAAIPLGLWAFRVVRFSLSCKVKYFMAWWALPSICLYAVSHVGQYGYALVALPPLLLLSALCIRVLAERFKDRAGRTRAATSAFLAVAVASAAYFALAQGPTTAGNIVQNDEHWQAIRSGLTAFDPASTVLIGSIKWDGPFRQAGYLLPDYHVYAEGKDNDEKMGWLYSAYGGQSSYSLPRPAGQSYLALPPGTANVIALDEETGQMLEAGGGPVRRMSLGDGTPLYILDASSTGRAGLRIDDKLITLVH